MDPGLQPIDTKHEYLGSLILEVSLINSKCFISKGPEPFHS
jgi:hypothetical protein